MNTKKLLKKTISLLVTSVFLLSIASTGFTSMAIDGPSNLALGKTVALSIGGGGTDNDPQKVLDPDGTMYTVAEVEQATISRLTDGVVLNGSGAVFETNWVGGLWNGTGTRSKYVQFYRNLNRELTIDLGQISNLNSLSMSFGACATYGISLPVSLSYYISQDGINYYLAGTVEKANAIPETVSCTGEYPMAHSSFALSGLNYNARYVKILFDVSVWLFSDEVQIMGTASAAPDANPLPATPYIPEPIINAYADTSQSDGIKHEALVYSGWYRPNTANTAVTSTIKTKAELLSYIAYVNSSGTPTDWLFNSITFLNHGYDNQGKYMTYRNNIDDASQYSDKAGWKAYLDYIFDYDGADGAQYNLDALDAAVADARTALNNPNYTVGVKIAIMPPVHVQSNWGQLVDGVGQSLDFTVAGAGSAEAALANRLAAVNWYVNEVITRFKAKGYSNITLDGFYYYDEVIRLANDSIASQTIKGITNMVHTATYYDNAAGDNQNNLFIYWIPYYQAEGFSKWAAFGFDYAIMQPNYAFDTSGNTTRLADSAALAKKYGLGIEMELGGLSDGGDYKYLTKFREYLTSGADARLGYQNNSLIAWYTGTWDLYNASIDNSGARYIYDAIYKFVQGQPVSFEKTGLTTGKPATVVYHGDLMPAYAAANTTNMADIPVLTNGKYGTDAAADYLRFNAGYFTNKAVYYDVTLPLQGKFDLESLSMSFYQRSGWGIQVPNQVTYSISVDGTNWTEVGTALLANAVQTPITTAGSPSYRQTYTLTLAEKQAARYIRATFTHSSGNWMYADELEANGSPTVVIHPPYVEYTESDKEEMKEISISYQGNLANEASITAWDTVSANVEMLTDGIYGAGCSTPSDYVSLNRNVLGYKAAPYDIVARLQNFSSIDDLSIVLLERTDWGINVPDIVTYSVSKDGKEWTEAGRVDRDNAQTFAVGTNLGTRYHFVLSLHNTVTAKYIKATFAHSSEAKNNFLYIDQLEATCNPISYYNKINNQ